MMKSRHQLMINLVWIIVCLVTLHGVHLSQSLAQPSKDASERSSQPRYQVSDNHSLQGILIPFPFLMNLNALYEYRAAGSFRLKVNYNQWLIGSDRWASGTFNLGYLLAAYTTSSASHGLEVTLGAGYSWHGEYCGGARSGWTCNQRDGVLTQGILSYRYQDRDMVIKLGPQMMVTLEGDYYIVPEILIGVTF